MEGTHQRVAKGTYIMYYLQISYLDSSVVRTNRVSIWKIYFKIPTHKGPAPLIVV